MCLNPIHINVKPSFRCPLKSEGERSKVSFVPKDARSLALFTQGIEVGCGKCIECVKSRQFDYAQYFERICRDYNTMFYCTLTYADEKVPICRYRPITYTDNYGNEILDYVDRRVFSSYHPRLHQDEKDDYMAIDSIRLNVTARLSGKDNFPVEIDSSSDRYTMSLCRRDVARWIKRCRVRWLRKYGKPMSDFKIFYIGEYGDSEKGATHRPHYHIVFLGCSEREFWYMVDEWRNTFGYVDTSSYKVTKGHEGYVTNYLSKYMVKTNGELGIEFKYLDFVERPRLVCSMNMLSLTEEEINHFRCVDLCSDVSCPIDLPSRCLERLEKYKSYYDKNGNLKHVPLVGHLKRRVMYDKVVLPNNQLKIVTNGNVKWKNHIRAKRKSCSERYYNGLSPAPVRNWKSYANGGFSTFFKVKAGLTSSFKPCIELLDIKKTRFVPIPLQVAVTHLVASNIIADYKRESESLQGDTLTLSASDIARSIKSREEMEKRFRARASARSLTAFYTHNV